MGVGCPVRVSSLRVNRRHVAVLGSTGSIGLSTLDVLAHLRLTQPQADWRVTLLSGHNNLQRLGEQAETWRPEHVVVTGVPPPEDFVARLSRLGVRVQHGMDVLCRLLRQAETGGSVVAAVVGAAGLPATFAAVEAGKRVCLANKESLVIAGHLLLPLSRTTGAELLPVDSEHSAIFQAIASGKRSEVRRVLLTASGGPFRTTPQSRLDEVTPEEALRHPTWSMGGKITIDSATLFNKALELLEARWLFDLQPDQLAVLVHPQSMVHSLVEFRDGNVLAQLSPPDMRTPIQYALTFPERLQSNSRRMNWSDGFELSFEPPDPQRFVALQLVREVFDRDGQAGGTTAAVFNAANEVAVEAFLSRRCRFTDIARIVRHTLNAHRTTTAPDLSVLLAADRWARQTAAEAIGDLMTSARS